MRKISKINLTNTLIILWLICSVQPMYWQASGNFTDSNMTVIWDYIHANFSMSFTGSLLGVNQGSSYVTFSNQFSTHLNSLWDPAWNVFVVFYTYMGTIRDSVLYGYAFRDHWFWYNGYKTTDGTQYAFIIWKDYNCDPSNWVSYNSFFGSASSNYDQTTNGALTMGLASLKVNTNHMSNVWQYGKILLDYFEGSSLFSNAAWTVLLSEDAMTYYFGRFCAKKYFKSSYSLDNTNYGTYLILQMR